MFELFKIKLDLYNGIDELPVWNWFRIHETNDLVHLLRKPHKIGYRRQAEVEFKWQLIHDEFLNTFGINDKLRHIHELKRDISVMKADMFLNKDASMVTLIEAKEMELTVILNETTNTDLYEVKSYVEKYMGRHINERTETVKSYYSCIKIMEKEINKHEQWRAIK